MWPCYNVGNSSLIHQIDRGNRFHTEREYIMIYMKYEEFLNVTFGRNRKKYISQSSFIGLKKIKVNKNRKIENELKQYKME